MIHVFLVCAFGWRVVLFTGIRKHGRPVWGDEYGHVEFELFMKHARGDVLLAVEPMCLELRRQALEWI